MTWPLASHAARRVRSAFAPLAFSQRSAAAATSGPAMTTAQMARLAALRLSQIEAQREAMREAQRLHRPTAGLRRALSSSLHDFMRDEFARHAVLARGKE